MMARRFESTVSAASPPVVLTILWRPVVKYTGRFSYRASHGLLVIVKDRALEALPRRVDRSTASERHHR